MPRFYPFVIIILLLLFSLGCSSDGAVKVRVGELHDHDYKIRLKCTERSACPADGLVIDGYVNDEYACQFRFTHENKIAWTSWVDISHLVKTSDNSLRLKGNHGLAELEYEIMRNGAVAYSGTIGNDAARSLGVSASGAIINF